MGKPIGRPKRNQCKAGHEYTPENTSVVQRGRYAGERRCKLCIKIHKANHKKKVAAKIAQRKESWFF